MILCNYADVGQCPLRGWMRCNNKHILAVCNFSLNNKRFNWRHDNVLRVIAKALLGQIEKFNNKDFGNVAQKWTGFRSLTCTYRKPDLKIRRESPFVKVGDWKMVWDEDNLPEFFCRFCRI